jgi:hypothetical protein
LLARVEVEQDPGEPWTEVDRTGDYAIVPRNTFEAAFIDLGVPVARSRRSSP